MDDFKRKDDRGTCVTQNPNKAEEPASTLAIVSQVIDDDFQLFEYEPVL